jgi:hypothetical protein
LAWGNGLACAGVGRAVIRIDAARRDQRWRMTLRLSALRLLTNKNPTG